MPITVRAELVEARVHWAQPFDKLRANGGKVQGERNRSMNIERKTP